MAAVAAVGSLVGGGGLLGGAAAGGTLSTLSTVAGLVGTVVSGISKANAQKAAGRSERLASEARARELELSAEKQRTQAALQDANRQKQLRITLAQQRARFGGAGIDPNSGSPLRLQQTAESEILRQDRQAGLFSSLTVSSLNRQGQSELRAGRAAESAAGFSATQTLIGTGTSFIRGVGDARDAGVF